MEELILAVISWAHDRNIVYGSTPEKQLDKTSEEFNELQRALSVFTYLRNKRDPSQPAGNDERIAYALVKDGIGDVLVTLIIAAHQCGLTVDECLLAAWDEIKNRKGRLVNGLFVKEET